MPQSINSVWTEQACNVITANESPVSCGTNCYQQTMNLYTNSAINVNDTIVSFFDADFAGSGAVTNWAIVDNTLGSGTINTVNSGGNTTISKVSGSSFTSGWVGGYILISGTAYQITGYTNSTTITALGNAGTLTGTSYTAGNSFTKLGQSDFNVTYSDPGGTRVVYGNEFYVLGSAYALSSNYSATMAVKYTGTFGDFDSNLLQFRQSSGGASLGVDSSQPWTVGTSASGASTCVPGVSGNFSTTCYLNTTTTTSVNPNDLILGVGNNVDWPMIGLSNSSIAIPCDGNGTTTPAFNAFGGNGTYPGFYYTLCLTAPSGTASFSSYQSSPSLGFNSTLLAFKPSNFTVGVPFSSSISGTQATLNAYLPFTNYPVAQLQTGENASDQIATLQFSDSNSSSSTLIPSDISVANDRIADSTELDTNLTQTNTLSAVYSEGQEGSLNGTPIAFSTQAAFQGGGVPSASALYISNGASQNIGIGSINPGSTIDVQGTIRAISNNVTTSVSTPGLSLLNSTASTGGVSQQNSPAFVLGGTSYQSSANKTVQIAQVVEPQSWGSTFWDLYSNINGAGWNKFFGLRTDNGSTSSLFLQPVGMDQDGVGQAFFGGFSLLNGGAATSGTQQYSPGVQFTTQGWSTTNSATYATTSGIFQKQTAGTTAPDGAISFAYGWTAGANNYNVSTSNDLLDLNFGPDTLGAAFNSSNTAGYTLTVKGNVGIGSTNPGVALDVNGTVRALFFSGNATSLTNLPITLTTLGSSGASTYTQSTNTLNIPQYTGGGGGNPAGISTSLQMNLSGSFAGTNVYQIGAGNIGIGSTNPGSLLDVYGTHRILGSGNLQIGTPAVSDTGILAQMTSSVAGYNQQIIQNTNSASNASSNYVVGNNNMTSSTYYGEFGMNSSGFTGTGSFNLPNAVYLDSSTADLTLGTLGNSPIHFVTNNGSTDSVYIGGNGNVGIGSMAPGVKLDIQGTVRSTAFIKSGGTSSQFLKADGSTDSSTYSTTTGTVTSVTLATPSSTLTLGGTNPVTTSGTINADINLTHANTWTGQQIFNTANVGIGSTNPGVALDLGTGAIRVGIGTLTQGTILCVKTIANSRATVGYCTGSLTNSICGTCN